MTDAVDTAAESFDESLPSDNVADLVEYLVVSLIDKPEDLSIDVTDGEGTTLIEVHVNSEDVGKVIGRHGRVIKAIRTLARACAARDELVADVEVIG